MMTISFFLKEPKQKNETMIYMSISMRGCKRKKYSSGVKVKPTQWNVRRIKPFATDATNKNLVLDNMEYLAKEIERDFLLKNISPTMVAFHEEFSKRFNNNESRQLQSFFDVFDRFIEIRKHEVSKNTIKTYNTLKMHLTEFQKTLREPLTFGSINMGFYDALVQYFFSQEKSNNTVDKNLTVLKTFLNWSHTRGFHENMEFLRFKGFETESEKINIPSEVVERLVDKDFGDIYKNLVRDVFLIACFTGLRYSDIQKIKKINVHEGFLSVFVEKTREKLEIPLLDNVQKILQRHFELYDGHLKVPTNQFCNREIKNCFKEIGFDTLIETTKKSGNKNLTERKPAYDCISIHDGRRFFVTNCIKNGMSQEYITKITGHKDYKSFRKYFRPSKEMIGDKLNEAWKL